MVWINGVGVGEGSGEGFPGAGGVCVAVGSDVAKGVSTLAAVGVGSAGGGVAGAQPAVSSTNSATDITQFMRGFMRPL